MTRASPPTSRGSADPCHTERIHGASLDVQAVQHSEWKKKLDLSSRQIAPPSFRPERSGVACGERSRTKESPALVMSITSKSATVFLGRSMEPAWTSKPCNTQDVRNPHTRHSDRSELACGERSRTMGSPPLARASTAIRAQFLSSIGGGPVTWSGRGIPGLRAEPRMTAAYRSCRAIAGLPSRADM